MAEQECGERLVETEYYPNCPGCKVERYKASQRGFPFRDLVSIWIIVLANALPISSLFPFLYFMIRDLHIAEREEDIAYYAGYVGSAYMLGRALTSVFWGVVADRYGRKPVIILGTISVIFFNSLFGLSVNYWMAITTRFLLGSLNGLLGPIKAYSSEIFREEHQALGMSTVSAAWGIGLVIGPALGGFFAQPAEKYPSIFSKNSIFGRKHNTSTRGKKSSDLFEPLETASCLTDTSSENRLRTEGEQSPKKSLLMNWPLMSSILVYCVFSLHDMACSEIFSLWALSPRKFGGLSYSTEVVGEVLVIAGFSLIIYQVFLYPFVDKLFGPILICRIAGALTIPLLTSFPYIALLSGSTLFVLINVASVIKSIFSVSIITGLFLLQNRAVEQEQRGVANGLSMTAMSMFKAIGPAAGGVVFSWAEKRQDASFLPGTHMVFFILNAVEAIGVIMTFKPFLTTPQVVVASG